ncbi:MAG: hypothetical protein Q8P18_14905 [Pseudomonadota bacterium]|nr:hypothetical protein [Pseudomonadota bacterium]
MERHIERRCVLLAFLLAAPLAACRPGVSSPAEAEYAYMGLDRAVERGLALGLQGFAAASSANIDPQEEDGETSGGMVISGQVDQGSSDNKGLRLFMALDDYSDTLGEDDEPDVFYQTDASDLPALNLTLKDMPEGTLDGTLAGTFAMDGVLAGIVELDVTLAGETDDDGTGIAIRSPGSTRITGTATSDYGVYEIDVTH